MDIDSHDEPATIHAFYSGRHADLYGYLIYRNLEGAEVAVTTVADDIDIPSYNWSDKQYVGLVRRHGMVRSYQGQFLMRDG